MMVKRGGLRNKFNKAGPASPNTNATLATESKKGNRSNEFNSEPGKATSEGGKPTNEALKDSCLKKQPSVFQKENIEPGLGSSNGNKDMVVLMEEVDIREPNVSVFEPLGLGRNDRPNSSVGPKPTKISSTDVDSYPTRTKKALGELKSHLGKGKGKSGSQARATDSGWLSAVTHRWWRASTNDLKQRWVASEDGTITVEDHFLWWRTSLDDEGLNGSSAPRRRRIDGGDEMESRPRDGVAAETFRR
ncbi:hypothetical protein LINPERHAP2_LOCUS460 [Linum perenne]